MMKKLSILFLALFALLSTASAQRSTYCDSLSLSYTSSVNGLKANFKPTVTGKVIKQEWSFGDGTGDNDLYASHTYSKYGTYKVCVTFKIVNIRDTSKPCIITYCDTISLKDPCDKFNPKASISVDSNGLAVFEADFDSAYAYSWDFGDKTTSNDRVGKHQYSKGTYQACVKVRNTKTGCYKYICFNINVGSDPCKGFNPSAGIQVDSNGVAKFEADSGANLIYAWDFGDGTYSKDRNGKHQYKAGVYKACVTIIDSKSKCSKTICTTLTIKGSNPCDKFKPTMYLVADTTGLAIFEATKDSNYTYYWEFGDSSVSYDRSGKHQYKPGVYRACVTIIDKSTKCSTTICKTIYVKHSNPCDNFNPKMEFKISSNGEVTFWGAGSNASSYTYKWTFGDGTSGTGKQITHTYKNGTYKFCVKITDPQNNCEKTLCETITINSGHQDSCKNFNPSFKFKLDGKVVYYSASKGTHYTYSWTFGSIGTGHTHEGKFDFKKAGKYKICVTIEDTVTKCKETICKEIVIKDRDTKDPCKEFNPKVSFTKSGAKVKFEVSGAKGSTFVWDFGDSSHNSKDRSPSHTYTKSGKYTVCVVVYDAKRKCTKKICFTIEVKVPTSDPCDSLKPKFGYSVKGNKVVVEADKLNNVEYSWTWGDKQTDTGRVADHNFKRDGKYTICLTVYDKKTKCKKTVCSTVILKQLREGGSGNEDDALIMYPNPVQDLIWVVTKSESPAKITIRDTNGTEVLRYDASPDNSKKVNMLIETLSKGVYFMYVEQDGNTTTTKFVK